MWKNRFLYLVLCFIFGVFGIFYNTIATFIIFFVILIFPFISGVILRYLRENISVNITVNTFVVRKHEEVKVTIHIENTSRLPISKLEFFCTYYNNIRKVGEKKQLNLSFMPQSIQEIELSFIPEYVGIMVLEIEKIAIWDYTRCVRKNISTHLKEDITVLPIEIELDKQLNTGSHQLFEYASVLLDKPGSEVTEILDIREYIPGDYIARIHWKLSSKCDTLMIKEYANQLYYAPLFLLDLRLLTARNTTQGAQSMRLLEARLQAFISIAVNHIDDDIPVEVGYYQVDSDSFVQHSITSREELYQIMHELFLQCDELDTNKVIQSFVYADNAYKYSNILYFTSQFEEEIVSIERLGVFVAYFVEGELEKETQQMLLERLENQGFCVVDISRVHETIPTMAYSYMRGSRGDVYVQ